MRINVATYDENTDTFGIEFEHFHDGDKIHWADQVDAGFLSSLVKMTDEPEKFIGKVFTV